jgi:hypothetical protein
MDADSIKLIYRLCNFNPHAFDEVYKSQLSEKLKARCLNNTVCPKSLTIKDVGAVNE